MNKNEVIEMLEVLIDSAYDVVNIDGPGSTIIKDVKLDSFIWVINETIGVLETDEESM